MKTKNKYRIPIDMAVVTRLSKESIAHTEGLVHAIDYDAPEGTPVFAAQDGIIIAVKNDSNRGGLDRSFENDGNYVEILHDHNEVSEYEHLRYKSATLRVGDQIQAGQKIAEVGNTRWSECAHLHFMVYPKNQDYKTLEIQFES